jgi:toxin ParE1/3/4
VTGYVISPEAQIDLQDIFDFTVVEWGEVQAEKYLYELYSVFERLVTFPMMGRARPKLVEDLRSFPLGAHIIFYLIWEDQIAIARVLHASRDVESLF